MSDTNADYVQTSSCRALNTTTLFTNTSDTSDGVFVKVTCAQGYQLVSILSDRPAPDVFQCTDTVWTPSLPRCIEAKNDSPAGIIAGCVVGGVVCLAIVIIAVYMLCRSRTEGKQEKENDMLHKSKIMHLNFFMSSFLQDNVGMPAVTEETMDNGLRGVTSSDTSCQVKVEDDTYSRSCTSSVGGGNLSRRGSFDSITSAGDLDFGNKISVEKF